MSPDHIQIAVGWLRQTNTYDVFTSSCSAMALDDTWENQCWPHSVHGERTRGKTRGKPRGFWKPFKPITLDMSKVCGLKFLSEPCCLSVVAQWLHVVQIIVDFCYHYANEGLLSLSPPLPPLPLHSYLRLTLRTLILQLLGLRLT